MGVSIEYIEVGSPRRIWWSPRRIWGSPRSIWGSPRRIWWSPRRIWGSPRRIWGSPRRIWGSPTRICAPMFVISFLFFLYLLKNFHVILSYNNFDIFHRILKIVYFVNNRIVFVLFFVIYNIFCHVYLHLTINPTTIFYVCAYLLFFVHTTYKHIFMWVCIQKYFSPK